MAIYDVEQLMTDIKSILTTNLNTKLTAITTEKGDSLSLGTVSSSAYFIQDINTNAHLNYNPFIYMGIEEVETVSEGPNTSKIYSIPVILVVADNGTHNDIYKILYRYGRALEEVISEHWNETDLGVKLEMKSLTPVSWKLENSDARFKAIGVMLAAGLS